MSLGLVIPARNDHAALARTLDEARRMAIFDQVVVVDDGSDPAIDLDGGRFGPARPPLTVLRNARALGPGAARNRALAHVRTDYMVYLDSDDRLAPEFPAIWRDAAHRGFDLCLFRHHDTRREDAGGWGQMPQDDALWWRAGLLHARLDPVDEAALTQLAETANYPWNRIHRTAFLRDHGLGCAETLVHQDILLHWLGLLLADRVLASGRVGVVHRVAPAGTRLTNRRGPARLQVFDVLAGVLDALEPARPRRDLVPAFWRFASGLFDWIRGRIDFGLMPRWRAALRDFLTARLSPAMQAELAHRDPVLALRLTLQMAEGAPPAPSRSP